jgi:crotonobetainyl-CoA:carnitine CoA-transferase CaiB-like acyl-CoA transferase
MIDTAIVNAQLLACSYAIAYPDGRGVVRPRIDAEQYGYTALNRLYETAEGWLCIVIATGEHWQNLCAALEFESLTLDPRFASADSRREHDDALVAVLTNEFHKRSAVQWFAALDGAGVPCEISDPDFSLTVHDDLDLIKRRWVVSYPQHYVGQLNQVGLAFDLSDTPGTIQGPPLIVGEQTIAILTELGYSAAQIEDLAKSRAIATWTSESAPGGIPQNPWLEKTG